MTQFDDITPIDRLREFVRWTREQGMSKGEGDFERQCSLSPNYISNNKNSGRGDIGTKILGRITRVFPQLNLRWLCIGEGHMLNAVGEIDLNEDYRQAYEGAMMQIDALNRLLRQYSQFNLKN